MHVISSHLESKLPTPLLILSKSTPRSNNGDIHPTNILILGLVRRIQKPRITKPLSASTRIQVGQAFDSPTPTPLSTPTSSSTSTQKSNTTPAMSDLQRSLAKPKYVSYPATMPSTPFYEAEETTETDNFDAALPPDDGDSSSASSASSASSTGTVIPSSDQKLFARPRGSVRILFFTYFI